MMIPNATTYPKIRSVTPLEDYQLRITFRNDVTKIYDCSDVLNEPAFSALRDKAVFRSVHVDHGGYGVFWNDDIDLSEAELWLHGEESPPHQETAMSVNKPSVSRKYAKDTRTKQCT